MRREREREEEEGVRYRSAQVRGGGGGGGGRGGGVTGKKYAEKLSGLFSPLPLTLAFFHFVNAALVFPGKNMRFIRRGRKRRFDTCVCCIVVDGLIDTWE